MNMQYAKNYVVWTLMLLVALPIAGIFFAKEALDKAMKKLFSQ